MDRKLLDQFKETKSEQITCRFLNHSQQQFICRYHNFLVSVQLNPYFDRCQNIFVHQHLMKFSGRDL
jgi:hypothetical protein